MTEKPQELCSRCNSSPPVNVLRSTPTCAECYASFLENKVGRRIASVNRATNITTKPLAPRRYLAGLSLGPCSAVLVKLLDSSSKAHSSKKGVAEIEPRAVYIDTSLTDDSRNDDTVQAALGRFRTHFENVEFDAVCLSQVLDIDTIDWASLGIPTGDRASGQQRQTLRGFLEKLPSITSRADMVSILVKHLLMHLTIVGGYRALMLGHSTTALAASTLTQVASGRGFSVPFHVNDGPLTLTRYGHSVNGESKEASAIQVAVYYPMREVFKSEVREYVKMLPTMRDLIPFNAEKTSNVVSHKDVSIEEIMNRYFESVEGPYAGIVANVVRTSGKLDKIYGTTSCGLCGMSLDELGNATWAGEMGDDDGQGASERFCYGCARSVSG